LIQLLLSNGSLNLPSWFHKPAAVQEEWFPDLLHPNAAGGAKGGDRAESIAGEPAAANRTVSPWKRAFSLPASGVESDHESDASTDNDNV
jgi:hypothetical protein